MRSSKINYLMVGTFVITMIAALVVSVAMLTGRTGATDDYFAVYNNVTGVSFGTQVVYEGYPIGQVEKVTPLEKGGRMEFRVDFSVIQGWRIPNDSRVEIAAPSLLSAKTLAIHAGVSGGSLNPGQQLNSRESTNVFGAVSSLADEMAELIEKEAKPLLENVNKTIGEINRLLIGEGDVLIRDVSALIQSLSDRVPAIADRIEVFSTNMTKTSAEIRKLVSPNSRQTLERIIGNMDEATNKFDAVLIAMDQVLADFNTLILDPEGDVGTSLSEARYVIEAVSRHVDTINQNMEGAARNMNEFSRQIRANPGLLLGGGPQQDQAKSP